jgi:hypothetical protein
MDHLPVEKNGCGGKVVLPQNPCAGIIQIRFNGYVLRLLGRGSR